MAVRLDGAQREDLARAAAFLTAGELVAIPTETVYGLAATALDSVAVAKIFAAKERPSFDPLIVHVADVAAARALTSAWSDSAERLARTFWPGPLTLVLPKSNQIPDLVTSGLPSVALRIPNHPVALALLEAVGQPLAAPSANRFGRISPTTADHVDEQLGERIAATLDGGPCSVGVESTVLGWDPDPILLRPGGIPLEALEAVLGPILLPSEQTYQRHAPGRLPQHYAPRTPLLLNSNLVGPRIGLLAFQRSRPGFGQVEVLSGDLTEAAAQLFAALRRLDAAGLDAIVADAVPEIGLGRAIMDRLRRASHG